MRSTESPFPLVQAFATRTFPEVATKAARAVFPMHANLDEKIREKFGRGVANGDVSNSGESRKALRSS